MEVKKAVAEFVTERISLPIQLSVKDWKTFEKMYRPTEDPCGYHEGKMTNIVISTEDVTFRHPDMGELKVKLGVGWRDELLPHCSTLYRWREKASVFIHVDFEREDEVQLRCTSRVETFHDERDEKILDAKIEIKWLQNEGGRWSGVGEVKDVAHS